MLCQAHAPTLAPPHHKTTELARHQIEMAQQGRELEAAMAKEAKHAESVDVTGAILSV